jgi:hypothetical protein
MSDITLTEVTTGSRAVLRRVEAGNLALCSHCGEQVKFAAKQNRQQVIANVYVDARWDRVEHFHAECYPEAGEPFGTPAEQPVFRRRASS